MIPCNRSNSDMMDGSRAAAGNAAAKELFGADAVMGSASLCIADIDALLLRAF